MDRLVTVTRICNLDFETVADQFAADPEAVLRLATDAAAAETNEIVLNLESRWAWFDLHETIRVEVGDLSRTSSEVMMLLSWDADLHKRLLPAVTGHLTIVGVSSKHTEISFLGDYSPPSGLLPSVGERVLGRRVIGAAIGHLLDQIVAHLEEQRPVPAIAR